MDHLRIQADFVIVSESNVLHPGQIVLSRGKIVQVTGSTFERPDLDVTDSVLVPGLINAHTHLEFSDLSLPLTAGPDFPAWISKVIAHRHEAAAHDEQQVIAARRAAILNGITESVMTGTCVMGDIVTHPWQPEDLPSSDALRESIKRRLTADDIHRVEIDTERLREHLEPSRGPAIIAFAEAIGLTTERCQLITDWIRRLVKLDAASEYFSTTLGISPHAPYSVLMPQVEKLLQEAPCETPTAMHLAESLEEVELLAHGTGPFRERFDTLGIPTPTIFPTIEDCIRLLARRKHSLLIHGNYLTELQISLAAATKSITCVYCPRTHEHFSHKRYPLTLMHKYGLPVVFGTDSRASNPDLNLWSEMVAARRTHPGLSPAQALAAITSGPAQALGLQDSYGSLAVGKVAEMNVVPRQPHWNSSNLLDEMTSSPLTCQPLARISS